MALFMRHVQTVQCRPRSEAQWCRVWSGIHCLLTVWSITIGWKNEKIHPAPNKTENGLLLLIKVGKSIRLLPFAHTGKYSKDGIVLNIFSEDTNNPWLDCIYLSKQGRPWWNTALCGISSGSSLFARVPIAYELSGQHFMTIFYFRRV